MSKVTFSNLLKPIDCEGKVGESLLDIALNQDISMEHACGGFCACATCHIEVREGLDLLSLPEEDERERLEQVPHPTPYSRLACQAKLISTSGQVKVEIQNLI